MLAHTGHNPVFSWLDWSGHPSILIGALVLEVLYLMAVGPLRNRFDGSSKVANKQVISFTLGVFSIFLALHSPLDLLSDEFLFSAHMVQHLLLVLVAPPLLLMGVPNWLLMPIRHLPILLTFSKIATFPVVAALLFNILFAVWHVPVIYEAGLRYVSIHIFQHIIFIITGVIMWWPVLSPMKLIPRIPYAGQVLYLFVLSIPPAIVGALITFAEGVLYPTYAASPEIWGISAQADQQIGGVIMKIPGFLIFILAAGVIFFRWSAKEEARDKVDADLLRRMRID